MRGPVSHEQTLAHLHCNDGSPKEKLEDSVKRRKDNDAGMDNVRKAKDTDAEIYWEKTNNT